MVVAGPTSATVGLTVLTAFFAVGVVLGVPGPTSHAIVRAHLDVTPSTVGAPGDVASPGATCAYASSEWNCSLTLAETSRSNAIASWTTSSSAQATFLPSHGTLRPGTSVNVTVIVSSCGGNYRLNFTGPQNTAQATFACG